MPFLSCGLMFFMFSCSKYITHFSSPAQINQQDKVIVVCNNENLQLALENALLNKGIFVKNIETEIMFKSEMDDQINVEKYTYLQSLISAIKRGGKVKGTDKIFDNIREWNDLKDELIRVEDYSKLILKKADAMKKVYEVFGIDFIVSVQSQSKSKYAVRMISIKDNRLVFTMYLNFDSKGIDKLFPPVTSIPGTLTTIKSKDELSNEQLYYIRFASYLVDKMIFGSTK